MDQAIESGWLNHLKGNGKNSVIGRYNESYNAGADETLSQLIKNINSYNERISAIDKRLNELEQQDAFANDKCQQLRLRIEKNQDSKELAEERNKLEKELAGLEVTKKEKTGLLSVTSKKISSLSEVCTFGKKVSSKKDEGVCKRSTTFASIRNTYFHVYCALES